MTATTFDGVPLGPVYAIERDTAALAIQLGGKGYLYWTTISTGATESIDLDFELPDCTGRAFISNEGFVHTTSPSYVVASRDGAWHFIGSAPGAPVPLQSHWSAGTCMTSSGSTTSREFQFVGGWTPPNATGPLLFSPQ